MNVRTILTIEDDAAIRCGIVDCLEFSGYHVLEAANGSEGLEMAMGCQYELLLLDLALPGLGGLEILRILRNSRPTTPVIILSARGRQITQIDFAERVAFAVLDVSGHVDTQEHGVATVYSVDPIAGDSYRLPFGNTIVCVHFDPVILPGAAVV